MHNQAMLPSSTEATHFPFSRNQVLRTRDLEEAQSLVNRHIDQRRFTCLKKEGNRDIVITHRQLGNTTLFGCRYGASVNVAAGPLSASHFIIPLDGAVSYVDTATGDTCAVFAGDALSFPCDREVSVTWSDNCMAMVVAIDRRMFERFLFDEYSLCGAPHGSDYFQKIDLRKGPGASLGNVAELIYREDARAGGLLDNEPAAASVEKLLYESVWQLQHKGELERYLSSPKPVHVRRALEYITAHIQSDVFSMDALAKAVGCSKRSLERGFMACYNMGPVAYIKKLRLRKIREALESGESAGETIADVAARWGFYHGSNFASSYFKEFGERPSETVRR